MADHVAVGPGQSMVTQTQAAQSTSIPHSTDPTFITAHISNTAIVQTHRFTYNDLGIFDLRN